MSKNSQGMELHYAEAFSKRAGKKRAREKEQIQERGIIKSVTKIECSYVLIFIAGVLRVTKKLFGYLFVWLVF